MKRIRERSTGPPAVSFDDDEARWQAVVRRDRSADGAFYYSVRTTGVYCRPSCAARQPRRENVRFHATRESAERAGFRPCRRCRPAEAGLARHRDAVARASRLIETAAEPPGLAELARAAGLSPYHFHRVFKMITGVTPKQYSSAHRSQRVRDELARGSSVTGAVHGAGFQSSGRFYESAAGRLGMTPSAYRAGGAGTTIRFAVGECSLGSVLVAASDRGVCAILLGDDPDALARDLQERFPAAHFVGGDREFDRWVARVVGLVEQPARGLDLPLDIRGTAFQVRVWEALRSIPPGSTASYRDIAGRIGRPTATRAVAQACAANPLAVAIPCHRVVRTDESLSGYRWGVERKAELLRRERAAY
jgi:AraC family transcriptional regulator of adaptative response/methylated-DNA-[protein]-cysteine methyltransferase